MTEVLRNCRLTSQRLNPLWYGDFNTRNMQYFSSSKDHQRLKELLHGLYHQLVAVLIRGDSFRYRCFKQDSKVNCSKAYLNI